MKSYVDKKTFFLEPERNHSRESKTQIVLFLCSNLKKTIFKYFPKGYITKVSSKIEKSKNAHFEKSHTYKASNYAVFSILNAVISKVNCC